MMRRQERNVTKSGATQSEEVNVSEYEKAFVVVKLDGASSRDTATLKIYGSAASSSPVYGEMISSVRLTDDTPSAHHIDVRGVALLKVEASRVSGGSVTFQIGTFGTTRFGP